MEMRPFCRAAPSRVARYLFNTAHCDFLRVRLIPTGWRLPKGGIRSRTSGRRLCGAFENGKGKIVFESRLADEMFHCRNHLFANLSC